MSKRSRRALLLFAAFYIAVGALLTWQQERLIYRPSGPVFGECPYLDEATTRTYRDTRLYTYLPDGAPVVVLYHGNAGSACDRGRYLAPRIVAAGYGYVLVEYAGYGGDDRVPSHAGLHATVQNIVAFVDEHITTPVTLIGESIGSGAAALHLIEQPPEHLILITPLTTLSDVAARQYWFYPTRWLVRDPFNVPTAVSDYVGTSLVLLAEEDRIVPPDLGHEVYAALGGAKALTVVENAGHNDLMSMPAARGALNTFLRTTYPNDTY